MKPKFQYWSLVVIVLIFALLASILFVELRGVQVNYGKNFIELLPDEYIVSKSDAYSKQKVTTLVIWDSESIDSVHAKKEFENIFFDMRVAYNQVDVSVEQIPDYNDYEAVVVMLSDITPMGNEIIELCNWVYAGGNAMFPVTLRMTPHVSVLASKLGIMHMTHENKVVDTVYVSPDFMIGGGRTFIIDDPYDSAWHIQLSPKNTTVYMSLEDENGMPLVWRTNYGDGIFVVDNFGICEKSTRGFYAASYSLLGDVMLYPVINGSVFYLDDFPSQIPSGDSKYIERDYQVSIRDFYINIWWQDMMNIANDYNLSYTGLAIECYDDAVDGTTDAKPDQESFLSIGNMLLRQGGEIGYHGYNHQPLCLDDCDYQGLFDYKTWESYDAMKKAFDELISFCDWLFPDAKMSIYVPPSNILSTRGREFLAREYPEIHTISGIYFEDSESAYSCVQEFDIGADGLVDQPRIISGCDLSSYMEIAAISELNFHFVNSHFTHPDDALDPERGAELGWEALKTSFRSYLDWLYSSAPPIRNMTGSEMSAAVQRFAAVSFEKEITDTEMSVTLNDFYDEACFLVRFNKADPSGVTGGTLEKINNDTYLLTATEKTVRISLDRSK